MNGPVRPKGLPRPEWNAMSNKQKGKFLNFNIQTTQNNSGTQQYGVGGSIKAAPKRRMNNTSSMTAPNLGDSFGARRSVQGYGGARTNTNRPHARRELIASIYAPSSGGFEATQFPIQPANTAVFPWVGSIAAKYQKWMCVKLGLEFIPTVETFANAGKQGRIVIAANYDSLDGPLTNLVQAETISPNQPGKPTEELRLTLNPRQVSATPKLIRVGQVPAGGTITAFDGGVFYMVVDGLDPTVLAGTKIGELFVTYDFDFYDPIIPGLSITPAPTHSSLVTSSWDVTLNYSTGNYTHFPDMGTNWNGLNLTIDRATGSITFPPGRYACACTFLVSSSGNITAIHHRLFNGSGAISLTERKSDWNSAVSLRVHTAQWNFAFEVGAEGATLIPQYFMVFAGTAAPLATQWPSFLFTTV